MSQSIEYLIKAHHLTVVFHDGEFHVGQFDGYLGGIPGMPIEKLDGWLDDSVSDPSLSGAIEKFLLQKEEQEARHGHRE